MPTSEKVKQVNKLKPQRFLKRFLGLVLIVIMGLLIPRFTTNAEIASLSVESYLINGEQQIEEKFDSVIRTDNQLITISNPEDSFDFQFEKYVDCNGDIRSIEIEVTTAEKLEHDTLAVSYNGLEILQTDENTYTETVSTSGELSYLTVWSIDEPQKYSCKGIENSTVAIKITDPESTVDLDSVFLKVEDIRPTETSQVSHNWLSTEALGTTDTNLVTQGSIARVEIVTESNQELQDEFVLGYGKLSGSDDTCESIDYIFDSTELVITPETTLITENTRTTLNITSESFTYKQGYLIDTFNGDFSSQYCLKPFIKRETYSNTNEISANELIQAEESSGLFIAEEGVTSSIDYLPLDTYASIALLGFIEPEPIASDFSLSSTPELIPEFESFTSDQNPRFELEYLTASEDVDSGYVIDSEFTETESVEIESVSRVVSIAESQISAKLLDKSGADTNSSPTIEIHEDGTTYVEIETDERIEPGEYQLEVTLKNLTDDTTKTVTQPFLWGVIAINTLKSSYGIGEEAPIYLAVLNPDGSTVCNANIGLIITSPSGKKSSFSTSNNTIVKSDECGPHTVTYLADYSAQFAGTTEIGEYQIDAIISHEQLNTTAHSYITVIDNPEVVITRFGPTRIYPASAYEVKFDVYSENGFSGAISERVPKIFSIEGDFTETTYEGETEIITWETKLKKGETKSFRYIFNPPYISPELFILGPVSIPSLEYTENRRWEIASDAVGDFAIYREATALDTITTTATDMDWDTTTASSSTFTLQGNNIDIDLADAGHYLVMYTIPTDSVETTNTRSEIQSWLRINNTTDLVYGRGQGYIRRSGGNEEGYNYGSAIIDVSAGDDVRVQAIRTDSSTANTVKRRANLTGITLLKLDDSWDYIRTRPTSTDSITTTSFVPISFATDDEIDSGTFSRTNEDITLQSVGHYLVTYNVGVVHTSASIRTNDEARLTLGDGTTGTEVDGTRVTTYLRGTDGTNNGMMAWAGIIETSSTNQVLNLEVRRESEVDPGGHTTIVGETGLTIVKLPDYADYVRLGETTGGQNLATSQTPLTFNSTIEEDTTSFDHDSTNTSRVNIDSAADYLFFHSIYSARPEPTGNNGNRETQFLQWQTNGTTTYQYGSSGQFNRGDQGSYDARTAGSSNGIIAHSLSATDYIELTQINEAADADSTYKAGFMGLQGLNLDSLVATNPVTTQKHFRWRDDTTALNTTGGWHSTEDATSVELTKFEDYRLRLSVANIGTATESASRTYELEYGEITPTYPTCADITTWTGVADASDVFDMYNSTNITSDGQATTQLLSNVEGYTFIAGEGRDLTDTTGSIGPLSANRHIELEYTLTPTADAQSGANYCFRVYDATAAAVLDGYDNYPQVSIPSTGIPLLEGMEWGNQTSVSDSAWTTINFTGTYTNPVFLCSVNYNNNIGNESDGTADSAGCRVQNLGSTSAQVQLQEPGASTLANSETIYWLVIEEGAYTTSDITIEAFSYNSTVTDGKSPVGWTGQAQSYTNTYTNPVVLGQVMTYNDSNFSFFWAYDGVTSAGIPTASALYTGKHISEDTVTTRNNETVGVVVVEQGNGTLGTNEYEAYTGLATIDRVDDATTNSYTFQTAFSSAPTVALISLAGVSGTDGPVPYLYGSSPLSTTNIYMQVAETEIIDTEQSGNTERIAYLALESAGDYALKDIFLDLDQYRFYQNVNGVTPSTPLGSQNTAITNVADTDVIRLRTAIQVSGNDLGAGSVAYKLQYAQSSTCSAAGSWTDVGAPASGAIWRGYNNSTPADGAAISSNLLSDADTLGTYEETLTTATNGAYTAGNRVEHDWVIENNNAADFTDYCFRVVTTNDQPLNYTAYPSLTTASITNQNPYNPTSLVQRNGVSDAVIVSGEWIDENSVKFTASASDPDSGDTLQLCIENDTTITTFSDTEDSCGTGSLYSGSDITLTHTLTGLTTNRHYHWQARIKDDSGAYSSWVSFDSNLESERDYGLDVTNPSAGTVYDGITYQVDTDENDGGLTEAIFSWSGLDDGYSGIFSWEYAIGTTSGATDVVTWTETTPAGTLYNNDFETGSLGVWDALSLDLGDLGVSSLNYHTKSYSASFLIDDNTGIYMQDNFTLGGDHYSRFYINPMDLTMTSSDEFVLVDISDSGTTRAQAILGYNGTSYYVRAYQSAGAGTTSNVNISNTGWTAIELHWTSAASASTSMWVDGTEYTTGSGNTSSESINRIQLGMITGRDTGTSGTFYIDNYSSDLSDRVNPIEHAHVTVASSGHLHTGQMYYVSVRATDNAGNTTGAYTSDGFSVLPTFSFSLDTSSIQFVNLNPSNSWSDTKAITTTASTNSYNGYTATTYLSALLTNTLSPSYTVPNYSGTNALPTVWSGNGFGYTTNDSNLSGGTANRFTSGGPNYSGFALTGPGDPIADHTTLITGTTGILTNQQFDITFKVTGAGQAAGPYSTDIIIIAIPNF